MKLSVYLVSVLISKALVSGHRIIKYNNLHVDVYHAAPQHVVYQGSTDLSFSPTTFVLIHGRHEAVLIDAPATVKQSQELANWIEETIPEKKLTAMYVTHGHGDHFLGMSILQERFHGLSVYATRPVFDHVLQQLEPAFLNFYWNSLFPGQIPNQTLNVDVLPANDEFWLEGHALRAVEVGEGDAVNSTVLHVPDLDLVAGGDVVYGKCFQMFEETNTVELQDQWIRSIHKVAALKPKIVIPAHMQPHESYGPAHLEATEEYISAWQDISKRARTWEDLENAIKSRYRDRSGSWVLRVSAQTGFNATF
jgi:glyoxylase-like metal-dependent hydrolase (beta-lactamase superfamily II)